MLFSTGQNRPPRGADDALCWRTPILHPRHSESCHLLPFLQMLTFRTPEPRQFPVGMQKPAFSEVLANISSGTVNRKAGSPCTLS